MASSRMQELEDMEMAESKVLKITEFVTANELASMMDVSVTQVIATCMSIGMMYHQPASGCRDHQLGG